MKKQVARQNASEISEKSEGDNLNQTQNGKYHHGVIIYAVPVIININSRSAFENKRIYFCYFSSQKNQSVFCNQPVINLYIYNNDAVIQPTHTFIFDLAAI